MHGQKFGVTRYIQRNVYEKQLIITIIIIIIIYKDLFRTEQHTLLLIGYDNKSVNILHSSIRCLF
jgi:hypothetical protein